MLVKVELPATAADFFGFLLRIVSADLIDLDEDFDKWLDLEET